jgi:tRNA(fMet)-specific endonuclease VapC
VIILDTDIVSIIQRGGSREYEALSGRLDSVDEEIVVTIITFEEQMRGWLAFIAADRSPRHQSRAYAKLHALLQDFSSLPVVDFDEACAAQFDALVRSGVRIGSMDLKIASTAIVHDALLLSRNLVDFRKVPGLRVEDWTS